MYVRLLKNTFFNAIGRFGAIISSVILTPIIISTLGDDRFAIWSLVTLVITYVGFLDFGVSGAYSKFIAEYHEKGLINKINGVIVCGIGLYLLISFFIIITGIPLIQFTPQLFNISIELQQEAISTFNIGLIIFAFASTFNVFESIPVGLQKMEYNNFVMLITSFLYVVVSIIYLKRGGGLIGLMVIRGVIIVLQTILLYFCSLKLLPSLSLSPKFMNREQAKEMLIFGLKVQAGKLAGMGTSNINRILVGFFVGLSGVAGYQIGSTIVMGVRDLAMLTFSGMTPMASQIESQNRRQDLLSLLHNGVRVSLVVSAAGFGLACAIADPIIVLWTGKHYPIAVMIIIGLSLANYIHVSTGTGTCLARGIGRPGLETFFGITLFFLNLILGWIFGRIWGIEGILVATLIAYYFSSLLFMLIFNRVIGFSNLFFLRQVLLPPTIALVSSLIVAFIMRQIIPSLVYRVDTINRLEILGNSFISGSIFFIIFSLILILFGYIRLHHLRIVIDFVQDLPFLKNVSHR